MIDVGYSEGRGVCRSGEEGMPYDVEPGSSRTWQRGAKICAEKYNQICLGAHREDGY